MNRRQRTALRRRPSPALAAWAAVAVAFAAALPAAAAELQEVRVGAHPGFTRVVFELDGSVGYRVERTDKELRVTLDARSAAKQAGAHGDVRGVQVTPAGDRAVVTIPLRRSDLRLQEMILSKPPRIVFDLKQPEPVAAATPAPKPKPVARPEPKPEPVAQEPTPKPAPVAKRPEPAPVAREPEPAPVAREPEPAPEPVKTAAAPKPEPAVAPAPVPKTEAKTEAKPTDPAPAPKAEAEPKPDAMAEPSAPKTDGEVAEQPAPGAAAPGESAPAATAPRPALLPPGEPWPPATAADSAAAKTAEQPSAPKPAQLAKPKPAPERPAPSRRAPPAPEPESGWLAQLTSEPLWLGAAVGGLVALVGIVVTLRRRSRSLPNDLDVNAIARELDGEGGAKQQAAAEAPAADEESSFGDLFSHDVPAEPVADLPASRAAVGPDLPASRAAIGSDVPASRAGVGPDLPASRSAPTAGAAPEFQTPDDHSVAPDSIFDEASQEEAPMNQDMDLPADRSMGGPPPAMGGARMEGGASSSAEVSQLLEAFERRLQGLEAKLEEANESREKLERQVAAQSEELRVQRAAIARTQRALRTMSRGEEDKATEPALRDGDTQAKTRING